MPKDTKTLGNNKARACESLGFVHKKRLCQRFDTTSLRYYRLFSQLYYSLYFNDCFFPFTFTSTSRPFSSNALFLNLASNLGASALFLTG